MNHISLMMAQRVCVLILLALALLVLSGFHREPVAAQAEPTPATVEPAGRVAIAQLTAQIEVRGAAPLLVELDLPGYRPQAFDEVQAAAIQEAAIASAQDSVLSRLAGFGLTNVKTFAYLPYLALTVHDAATLAALAADPLVLAIREDRPVPLLLSESVPLIRGHFAHIIFYRGQGQTVAVLDTGVDKNHPALAGKVVSEACYSTNSAAQGASSLCPGGATSSTANNSGLNCANTISGCDHGTHVAGIVAGVAPGANLIAIQVFSRFTDGGANTFCANANRTSPCTLSYQSDQIAALNRVFALRNSFAIASVNMSLGSGQFTSACDTDPVKPGVDLLRGANIATVIAAGNSSFRNAMGAPACISTAISVGATTKTDQVADFSNVNAFTTLWAPGFDIYAAIPPAFAVNADVPYQAKNGTSMAAPHVAGAVAILKQVKPAATVAEISNLFTSTGPLVTDQRTGGSITKRRLDIYTALCVLITCDNDDYRTLLINQSLTGAINPANDRDHYFFNGAAGNQVTIQMVRTSGNLDPYLELFDPNGNRVALNNNGGVGVDALINGFTLQQTGRYLIVARGANSATGNYSVSASSQAVQLNPLPTITSLSPASATGTVSGADFWVQIRGQNFMPQSQVFWNGALRTSSFSSSTLIWIRVRGSDLGLPWPRIALITVRNPEPGGGTSPPRPFSITFPFLGTSELVQPAPDSVVTTGISTTFVISWTHPDDSWRTMQSMDLRLRDQNNRVAAWIRVVERPGTDSVYRLLNAAESADAFDDASTPAEGLPGEDRNLVITDTVTLHLLDSAFFGSGQTATMTPTVTFGPNAVGVYNIEFRVDGPDGEVQDDDVLGQITIVPQECPFAITGVTLSGVESGVANTGYTYAAAIEPLNATAPVTITWAPEPQSGQGSATAVYNWPAAGEHFVFVGVENCGSFAGDVLPVRIRTSEDPDLAISKSAPATALADQPITYTLTISNSGALTATNLLVLDDLPAGARYLAGGSLVGDSVRWDVAELAGFGGVAQVTYTVAASGTITNSAYSVSATGGFGASGSDPVVTRVVDAQSSADAVTPSSLQQANLAVEIPAGAVFAETIFTLEQLAAPGYPLPDGLEYAGLAFRLAGFQANRAAPDLELGEAISLTVGYGELSAASQPGQTPDLYYWDGSTWTQVGLTCTPESEPQQLACTYAGRMLTQFALVTSQVAGVALASATQTGSGEPGATISYSLAVTNTGSGPDAFDLSVAGIWSASTSVTNTGLLPPGATASFTVSVTIPADAADLTSDTTTVTASSRFDSRVQEQTTLTTTARRPPVEAEERLLLPMIQQVAGSGVSASITGISVAGDHYVISFVTQGFTPQLPGPHVHFFFNTVPPSQAGMPGSGPWVVYGGGSPFTQMTVAERPAGASQICVLVANADHSVQLNTGNCFNLP
jgi:uncharacterized repeat protein (TIGR01451 family)